MDRTYDYLIIGAGLTGVIIAHELHKKGKSVLVVDKRNHIGGNCYTDNSTSVIVHQYGAHIFHTNKKWIWDYITSFGEFIPYTHQVKAKYKNELYDLPFNLNTYQQIYKTTPEESLIQLNKDIEKYKNLIPTNLEEQALKLVGDKIYNVLIKGYTEKQWGKSCTELSPEIIKRLPLRKEANNNYFNDRYQGLPKYGYTEIIEKMLEGIQVRLNYNYTKDSDLKSTTIIHTGMIDEYYNYCFGELEYRSLRFEHKYLSCAELSAYSVVNYTDKEIPFTRTIEHKHFNNSCCRTTIITEEYPEVYVRGKEAYYPINNEFNDILYSRYKTLAEKEHIIFCGRLGGYKYLDMDAAIEEAFKILELLERKEV